MSELNQEQLEKFVNFLINRNVSKLYKNFLVMLEDIRDNNYVVDEQTYDSLRKKILDSGNETIREIEESLSKFNLTLKK